MVYHGRVGVNPLRRTILAKMHLTHAWLCYNRDRSGPELVSITPVFAKDSSMRLKRKN